MSVSVTVVSNPVMLMLQPSSSGGYLGLTTTSNGVTAAGKVAFIRGSTNVGMALFQDSADAASTLDIRYPNSYVMIDTAVTPGTYTYKVQAAYPSGDGHVAINNMVLVAYELI